jgi:methionine-rich copper-binding protein CopC
MRRHFLLSVLSVLPVAAALVVSAPALAHPKLVSSQPAANSAVSKPKLISLTFAEKLVPQFSGFDLVMTGMPGMSDHAPMPISGFTPIVGPDGKTLSAQLPRALPAGSYELNWHAVAADTHRIQGKFVFSVK